jgi:hypothetical protein
MYQDKTGIAQARRLDVAAIYQPVDQLVHLGEGTAEPDCLEKPLDHLVGEFPPRRLFDPLQHDYPLER